MAAAVKNTVGNKKVKEGGGCGRKITLAIRSWEALCTEGDIQKFWEIEDMPQHAILSEEEACVEAHYKKSSMRLPNGTYEVQYPFFKNVPSLGNSREQAVTRYLRLEKQLERKNKRTTAAVPGSSNYEQIK